MTKPASVNSPKPKSNSSVTELVCLISDKSLREEEKCGTTRKIQSLTAAMEWISSARYAEMSLRAAAGMLNTVPGDAPTMRQSPNGNGKRMRGVSGQIIAKRVVNQWSKTRQPRYGGIARRLASRARIGRGNGRKRPVYRFDSPGRLTMPYQTYRWNRGNVCPVSPIRGKAPESAPVIHPWLKSARLFGRLPIQPVISAKPWFFFPGPPFFFFESHINGIGKASVFLPHPKEKTRP